MKKEKKFLIYGISMILITIVGISVAYFTTKMTGTNANVNVTTAKIGSISFTAEGVTTDNTKILPGWTSGDKTVVVTLTESDYDVEYTCTLNITSNNIADLTLSVAGDNALSSANKKIGTTTTKIEIASGTISSGESKTMTYNLTFPETGTNQDIQQNKTVTATVSCKTSGSTVYYNAENPGGTTTEPSNPNIISLTAAILRDNPTVSTRTDFSVTNKSNTTGTIYTTTATEDGSTVYYYSGNTTNNWVQFGGFYWRIIRTNEDGSVRMLYAGQTLSAKPMHIGGSMFNDIDGTPLEAGYMYGTSGSLANNRTNTNSSTIKQTIDTWYENNLLTNYDKYISKTAIYCNDRSIGSGTYSTSSSFYYGVYTRLVTNKTPTYKCGGNTSGGLFESTQSIEDKFSASTSGGGNGQLTYPIALITADEVIFAGGKYNTGLSSPYAWYISNATGTTDTTSGNWWVLSPGYWDSTAICLKMGKIASNGSLSFSCAGSGYVARPVLSLKSCVIYSSGDGTTSSPYQISIDDSCSNAVN